MNAGDAFVATFLSCVCHFWGIYLPNTRFYELDTSSIRLILDIIIGLSSLSEVCGPTMEQAHSWLILALHTFAAYLTLSAWQVLYVERLDYEGHNISMWNGAIIRLIITLIFL